MRFLQFKSHEAVSSVSCIGLGTIGAGTRETASYSSIKDRLRSLHFAFELGVNFFDAAESYEDGFSEELLGKFSTGKREKIIIATKFSPQNSSKLGVIRALEGSLRRLNTEYVDLYQMHWPNPNIPLEETMSTLEMLVVAGKIRHIGLGNCTIANVGKANSFLNKESVISNQIKLNLYKAPTLIERNYFNKSQEMLLTNIAYGIFGQGKLRVEAKASCILKSLCEKYGVSKSQLLIAWVLTFPKTMAMVRSMNHEHLISNINASKILLEKSDVDLIINTFENSPQNICVSYIKINNHDADISHKIYLCLDDAINNKYGLFPDVLTLAKEIETNLQFDPVELVKESNGYTLVQGRMRFWAWVYLYGEESKIPSVIVADNSI